MPVVPRTHGSSWSVSPEALANCAAEPIHVPGAVQPFGALLVLHPQSQRIVQASANAAALLGRDAAALVGLHFAEIAGAASAASVALRLRGLENGTAIPVDLPSSLGRMLAMAHRHDDLVLIELHPVPEGADGTTALDVREVTRAVPVGTGLSFDEFATRLVQQVRAVSGYDRVMLYRFDESGAGEVVAESRARGQESFLGLWYPAADIPPQARALYLQKRVRLCVDSHAVAVPLVPVVPAHTGRPTDLRHATLRAVSPVHLEYLRNMGVRGTLTLSVIRDGALWGLIACHHREPRWVPPSVLEACDLLAEMLSVQIGLVEGIEHAATQARVHEVLGRLRRSIAQSSDWPAALVGPTATLLDILDAGGAAVVRGAELWTVGDVPDHDAILVLTDWLDEHGVHAPGWEDHGGHLLSITDLLSADPTFAALLPHGCGILAAEVSHADASWLLWFRPEFTHTVRWGGEPAKTERVVDGTVRLAPRRSFAAWAETVRGRSRPWTRADRQAAGLLRTALVEEVLHLLSFRTLMLRRDLIRVRQAVEASSEAMVISDTEGRVLIANPAFTTLFGYTADDVRRGRAFNLRHAPFEDTGVLTRLRALLASDAASWRIEAWVRAADDVRVPVELRVDRIHDDTGTAIGFAATWHDLRARYQAADERQALETRMQQAQKLESLGVLAGGIAHDFNNLLTSILGFISLAHEELPARSPAGESLEFAEMAAQRAAELCRQLLAYSGRGRFVVEPLDLNRLIGEMRQLLDTVLSRNAHLRVEAAPGLPAVEGDATQLRQVVMNLLVNASDALGDRPGTITVETAASYRTAEALAAFAHGDELPPGRYVELRVADTGVGMDEATVARIFDPFFTTKFTGRGLGLAAVIGIVRGHRGALRVESSPGRGTTFTILLPALATAVQPDAGGTTPVLRASRGRTVLVVDDDDGVRRLAVRALTRVGHRVVEASRGDDAVAMLTADPAAVDLVLLDLVMPGMSGPEVLAALRTLRPDLPVLLTSGYDEQDATGLVGPGGADAFLQKPYRATELIGCVGAVLVR